MQSLSGLNYKLSDEVGESENELEDAQVNADCAADGVFSAPVALVVVNNGLVVPGEVESEDDCENSKEEGVHKWHVGNFNFVVEGDPEGGGEDVEADALEGDVLLGEENVDEEREHNDEQRENGVVDVRVQMSPLSLEERQQKGQEHREQDERHPVVGRVVDVLLPEELHQRYHDHYNQAEPEREPFIFDNPARELLAERRCVCQPGDEAQVDEHEEVQLPQVFQTTLGVAVWLVEVFNYGRASGALIKIVAALVVVLLHLLIS